MMKPASKLMSAALSFRPARSKTDLTPQEVALARDYIANHWAQLIRSHTKDDEHLIGLPHPFLVPSFDAEHEFDYNEMYYWDSYFMVQGLYNMEHKDLIVGIVENLLFMLERFKIIPNASRLYMVSRSQPPFLTTFIWEVYEAYDMGQQWLGKALEDAQTEYSTVWMGTRKPNARQVYQGLSRYYDFNYLHDIAETESGWDMTPRFSRKCLDYLPVDLNSLLYKYETDFAKYYHLIHDTDSALKWEKAASDRAAIMKNLMWDKSRNFYYDYNYVKQKQGNVSSLAGFYPMWAGCATEQDAKSMVKALKRFEEKGGLATTDQQFPKLIPGSVPTQWAYPNGWAPLQFIVVQGLERYGYHDDAKRIANKWLRGNLRWFSEHGEFLEKYNVVSPEKPPAKGVYPSQTGFGWTNAIFERFCKDYVDKA